MNGANLNWDQLPEAVVDAFNERLYLVEILLDPLLPEADSAPSSAATSNSTGLGSAPSAATCSAIGNADLAACCSTARGPPHRGCTMPRCAPSCWS